MEEDTYIVIYPKYKTVLQLLRQLVYNAVIPKYQLAHNSRQIKRMLKS